MPVRNLPEVLIPEKVYRTLREHILEWKNEHTTIAGGHRLLF
jgi:hypothetical protein